jgi:hypothetical protein
MELNHFISKIYILWAMTDSNADLVLTLFLLGSYSVPSYHRLTPEVAILGGDVC